MRYVLHGHTVPIVAGHAGKPNRPDPGAVDPVEGNDRLATYEVEHTIPVAELTARRLRDLGATAPVVTGSVGQTIEMINSMQQVLCALSIHFNGGGGTGFEMWVYPYSVGGNDLASAIIHDLKNAPQAWSRVRPAVEYPSRGIKPAWPGERARGFVAGVTAPAVLCELGFIDRDSDESLLHSALFREHVATSMAAGVASYAVGRNIS